MRPVNLIPLEERRGEQAPLRSGPLAYVLLATQVALLAGVAALVIAGNQVSERESEVAQLEVEDARASAKAESLVAYTQFRDMSEQRVTTVASLADSRFDWERVMRELALILPGDVSLVSLTASAAAGEGGGDSGLSGGIQGPSLELSGCADGQEGVAGFVTALKDIDGVTRVGVSSSVLGGGDGGSEAGDGGSGGSGGDCLTRAFMAQFEIVVAFDAAPVSETTATEAAPTTAVSEDSENGEGSEGEGAEGE
jgi:Tfp pilus assembly protein PilN